MGFFRTDLDLEDSLKTKKNWPCFQHVQNTLARVLASHTLPCGIHLFDILLDPVSYTHLTLPTNREV